MPRYRLAGALLLCANLAVADDGQASMPYDYLDLPLKEVADRTGVRPNRANNIAYDSADRHVFLETRNGRVDYADVELSRSQPCAPNRALPADAALQALGLDPAALELAIAKPDSHTYYDHRRGLQVRVACNYEGAPLSVGFSRRQYPGQLGQR